MDMNTVSGGVVQQTQQTTAANQQVGGVVGGAVNMAQAGGTQQTTGLFTQEQLNSIVQQRVNAINQAKDGEINQIKEQLSQAQQTYQNTLAELTGYKNRDTAMKAGVPDKFVDYAVFEAGRLAVNGKTFEAAMTEFVAANSALFGTSQVAAQTATVQKNTQNTTTQQQDGAQVTTQNTQTAGAQSTTGVVNNPASATVQQAQVTIGGTATGGTAGQVATQPGAVTDADVQAFLKARGLAN